jgi:small subunit ribosomal protein S5
MNVESQDELVEFPVAVNRVTKVVKGGRRFAFAVIVVVGDRKGRVGWGTGKAKEVSEARAKAVQAAKKSLVRIRLREGRTLYHDINGRFGAGRVVLRSAAPGTGIIAGGPMRAVFEAVGIKDVVAKSLGTSNPHNMVKATFEALLNISAPRDIAERRGKRIGEIVGRRSGKSQDEQAA